MEVSSEVGIEHRAMKARLSVRKYQASKKDATVTATAHRSFNAQGDAGNFTKKLLPPNAMAQLKDIEGAARQYHQMVTLPWGNSGSRLLPMEYFDDYSVKMRDYKQRFDAAVDDFLHRYGNVVEEARAMLGDMFDPADYMDVDDVRLKFEFKTEISPIETVDDFRVKLSRVQVERVKRMMQHQIAAAQKGAIMECWRRLQEVVEKMAAKLNDQEKPIFRDSLVENVRNVVGAMRAFNITNDPDLSAICEKVDALLCSHDPQILRKEAETKKATAQYASHLVQEINDKMGAFMRASARDPIAEDTGGEEERLAA